MSNTEMICHIIEISHRKELRSLPDNRKILMQHKLDSAKEKLESAKILLDNGNLKDSISRSYYAMFTSVRALLARDGVDFSKHAGVIAYFQKEYIKTGILDVKYSKYISQAFQVRNNADYSPPSAPSPSPS